MVDALMMVARVILITFKRLMVVIVEVIFMDMLMTFAV